MENRKKIEPLDGETLKEFISRNESRKGSKNKNLDTLTFNAIYKELPQNIKKLISYKDYMIMVNEICKTMRSLLVKGHSVSIPYFGTLQSRCNGHKKIVNEVNYKKLLKNIFDKSTGNVDEQETAKHNALPIVSIVLTAKSRRLDPMIRRARFCPMKYVVREIKNILFGTNLYVYPY